MSSVSVKKIYHFGTSGYRNAEEEGFNEAVIRQITNAIKDYLVNEIETRKQLLPVLLGGDTRDKSRQFIPLIAQLLKEAGLDVYQADSDIPSPVLAYAAKPYGGYNFLTSDAAVMPTPVSKAFEGYQETPLNKTLDRVALGGGTPEGSITLFDGYPSYRDHLKQTIGIQYQKIADCKLAIYYDPLYATGRNYLPKLLKEAGIDCTVIHGTDVRPEGYDSMPEPTGDNLIELSNLIKQDTQNTLKVGLANDGDADRFGVLDEQGLYLNCNDVLLLILYHLIQHKQQRGIVVRSQATTHALDTLASRYSLNVIQTPVGYKYIAEEFIEHNQNGAEPVLIGGESSGGVSVLGHIPEKDGLLANLLVLELMAFENKPLSQILTHVKSQLPLSYCFRELGIKTDQGQAIMEYFKQCSVEVGAKVDGLTIAIDVKRSVAEGERLEQHYGTRDGAKLYLENGNWLLIRASGTEPIVRVYAEGTGASSEEAASMAQQILDAVVMMLQNNWQVSKDAIKERK
jgi:phosphomannomutase